MAARVVRKTELARALDVLAARGVTPAAMDMLPGGAVRLHLSPPAGLPQAAQDEGEKAAWDEALA